MKLEFRVWFKEIGEKFRSSFLFNKLSIENAERDSPVAAKLELFVNFSSELFEHFLAIILKDEDETQLDYLQSSFMRKVVNREQIEVWLNGK